MSLLFHDCEDLNEATLHWLTKAYEAARVELSANHYLVFRACRTDRRDGWRYP
jgi:hypothetical protein